MRKEPRLAWFFGLLRESLASVPRPSVFMENTAESGPGPIPRVGCVPGSFLLLPFSKSWLVLAGLLSNSGFQFTCVPCSSSVTCSPLTSLEGIGFSVDSLQKCLAPAITVTPSVLLPPAPSSPHSGACPRLPEARRRTWPFQGFLSSE